MTPEPPSGPVGAEDADAPEAADAPRTPGRRRGRVAAWSAGGLLVVAAVAWVALCAWADDRMPRHAAVAGVGLGGLDRDEARDRLSDGLAERLDAPVRLRPGRGDVVEVPADEAGVALDVDASLEAAGAGDGFGPSRVWALLTGGGSADPVVTVDDAGVERTAALLTSRLDTPAREAAIRFADGEAVAVPGREGREVDPEALAPLLERAHLEQEPVRVPVTGARPEVDAAELEQAMVELGRPAMSGPVVLVLDGRELSAPPELFGRGLATEVRDGTLALTVDGRRMIRALEPLLARVGSAPVDARIEVRDGRPRVVPARAGLELDPQELTDGFAAAATREGEQRRLRVEGRRAAPDLTTAEARALGVRTRISTSTTYFPYAEYRNVNIGRAAEIVDGTLLEPGERFSLNEIVGERTAENGFTEGYIVSDGIFRKDLGGGVSQMATTTFDAMFFAGLEDVEHKPHSVYIDRYPEGREATVAWPTVDLRFDNDSPHGVLITASLTPSTPSSQGSVTVSMWSTKRFDVEARTSERYAFTAPSTRYLTDEDCEEATGSSGFSVDVFRDFRAPGSEKVLRTEKFHTDYIPSDAVVCGPEPAGG
ncbi:Vancomycin resistance protein YoaR, contains peptidoglycan-binding and VanW domains [Nocardioides scoriae]|uniref:Vancomycin resistance protein YoaR, contains peptidoglycan-binding and VanW domains n=1 Tax=Nocardioides scoriae TaxID=642780 RepID=A0A1H1SIR6_9ACTN|nr:VanW family protein [Nocardioides scoriae]SDS47865.1 Vancomycin resistance protein YoaR, contains peptidoglycan-binding and VanW domains [Nocardioides scoriae]